MSVWRICVSMVILSYATSLVCGMHIRIEYGNFENLTCYTCPEKKSNEECNGWAPNIPCPMKHTVCKTVHRIERTTGVSVQVDKMCALPEQCSLDHIGCQDNEDGELTPEFTMSKSRTYDTYSVFVGHIPSGTLKHELRDLFQACGEVVDAVILTNGHAPHPYYGFVRYAELSAVYTAVAELNSWTLKGSKLVVDIAQETREKIKQEKEGLPVTAVDGGLRHNQKSRRRRSSPESRTADAMYHSRLLESCTSLSLKRNTDIPINTSYIFEEMKKMKAEKSPLLWASVSDAAVNFSDISSRIMKSCRAKCDNGETLGEKKSGEFLSSLRTIMKEINTLIEPSSADKLDAGAEATNAEDNLLTEFRMKMDSEYGVKDSVRIPNLPNCMIEESKDKVQQHVNNCKDVHSYLSDSDSDGDQIDDYKLCGKGVDLCKRPNRPTKSHVAASYSSSSDDNALSSVDPAVIDFHLSKLREIDKVGFRSKTGDNTLEKLFSKCRTKTKDALKTVVRSESVESNASFSSNDGHVDDSGVESDCLRTKKPMVLHDSIDQYKVVGRGHSVSIGSTLPQYAVPDCNSFSMEEYVLKNRGRGRGVLGTVKTQTTDNTYVKIGRNYSE